MDGFAEVGIKLHREAARLVICAKYYSGDQTRENEVSGVLKRLEGNRKAYRILMRGKKK